MFIQKVSVFLHATFHTQDRYGQVKKNYILRLILLIILVFVGFFSIKQFWFIGDYCIGMENM